MRLLHKDSREISLQNFETHYGEMKNMDLLFLCRGRVTPNVTSSDKRKRKNEASDEFLGEAKTVLG